MLLMSAWMFRTDTSYEHIVSSWIQYSTRYIYVSSNHWASEGGHVQTGWITLSANLTSGYIHFHVMLYIAFMTRNAILLMQHAALNRWLIFFTAFNNANIPPQMRLCVITGRNSILVPIVSIHRPIATAHKLIGLGPSRLLTFKNDTVTE